MILELLIVLLLIKCVLMLFRWMRVFYFLKRLRNDMDCHFVLGHTPYFFGNEEKFMTSLQLVGKEAIKHGGLSKLRAFYKLFLVVADAEKANLILKNSLEKTSYIANLFKNLIGNGSILAPVGIWRHRRKILFPAFAQKNLNEFLSTFDKCSQRMVENLRVKVGKEPFSVVKHLLAFSMDAVCVTGLDLDLDIQRNPDHPFIKSFEEYIKMTLQRICFPWLHSNTIYENIPWYASIRTYISFMCDFVDDMITTKRKLDQEANDLYKYPESESNTSHYRSMIDILIKPGKLGSYTDLELREELLVLLLAGTETSATGAAFTLAMLARSTSVREQVHKEIQEVFGDSDRVMTPADLQKLKYLDAVIRETLRLYPPAPIIFRMADRNIQIDDGSVIPKGCDIILNLWAIQRNPRYWGSDAEDFNPERFINPSKQQQAAFVAFSSGPRNCIGYQYAMMSMKTVLCNLLRRYTVRHARYEDPVELASEPLKVQYSVTLRDTDECEIRLQYKDL